MQEWKPYVEWVEFAGKALLFASFWFVAPEIAGEERLKTLSKGALSTLATLAGFLGWLVTLLLILVLLGLVLPASVNPLGNPFVNPPAQEGLLAPAPDPFLLNVRRALGPIIMALAVVAGKLTRGWFEDRLVQPLVRRLSESQSLRSVWVRIGVTLFVVGSVLDMGWWLWEKKFSKLM